MTGPRDSGRVRQVRQVRRVRRVRRVLAGALAVIMTVATAAACTSSGGDTVNTARRAGQEVTAPSGDLIGTLVEGPAENGVATLVVVVTDGAGEEVFRAPEPYSTRHGVAIAWQSDGEVLWVLSSDVGTSRIERGPDGWAQTWLTPETRDAVPPEIDALR